MANFRSLTEQAGVLEQIQDSQNLIVGAGIITNAGVALTITTPNGSGAAGQNISATAGSGAATFAGGSVSASAGTAGGASGGTAAGAAGTLSYTGGTGGAATTTAGGVASVGGNITITAGVGGAGAATTNAAFAGGNITIVGGGAGANNGAGGANGGNVTIDGGAATGAGTPGVVNIGNTTAITINIGNSNSTTNFTGTVTGVAVANAAVTTTNTNNDYTATSGLSSLTDGAVINFITTAANVPVINNTTSYGGTGYWLGGSTVGTVGAVSTTDKVVFSTDTTAAKTSLNTLFNTSGQSGLSAGNSKGYLLGGTTFAGAGIGIQAFRVLYSTETIAAQITAELDTSICLMGSASDNSTKGYSASGGNAPAPSSTILGVRKTNFATDSTMIVSTGQHQYQLSTARWSSTGINGDGTKSYFCGGNSNGADAVTADKVVYSTDVISAVSTANLSSAREGGAGINASTKGYILGGLTNNGSTGVATGDKLTFSTDTTAATASSNLSSARGWLNGTGDNSTKGYAAGGASNIGAVVATADKITDSTDTTAATSTANLTVARSMSASLSAQSATTPTAVTIPTLTVGSLRIVPIRKVGGRNGIADQDIVVNDIVPYRTMTATFQAGIKSYFLGGATNTGAAAGLTTADRLIFKTSTTAALTTANLSATRNAMASLSDGSTRGYIAGGATNPPSGVAFVTSVDKLVYATDTTAASSLATISQARELFTGVGATTAKGYYAGGNSAGISAVVTTIDKLTYGLETSAAIAGVLSTARNRLGSVGDKSTKAYFVGGASTTTGTLVTADKITFSTDTVAATAGANLSAARAGIASISGATKGYFCGGFTGATGTPVVTSDSITYSTDTTAATTSANLPTATQDLAGNSDIDTTGYTAGGATDASGVGSVATAFKLTIATSTMTAQTSANLSTARTWLTGVGMAGCFILNNPGGQDDIPYAAGETIASGAVIYVNSVNGQAYNCQHFSSRSIRAGYLAIAGSAVNPGEALPTRTRGTMGGYSFATNGPLYIGSAMILGTPDVKGPYRRFTIGNALSATNELAINITYADPVSKCYFAGGDSQTSGGIGTAANAREGIYFSTDTSFVLPAYGGTTSSNYAGAAFSDGQSKSFIESGTTFYKNLFATDAYTSLSIVGSTARDSCAFSGGEGSWKGFAIGGSSIGTTTNGADRFQYATETVQGLGSNQLVTQRTQSASLSDGLSKGWAIAGSTSATFNSGVLSSMERFSYSGEQWSAIAATLSSARGRVSGLSEGTKGYIAGGLTNAATAGSAAVDKFVYSTETQSSLGNLLTQARWGAFAGSDGMSKGYYSGGASTANSTTSDSGLCDKVLYATDTFAAQASGNLLTPRSGMGCSEGSI